MCIRDRTESGRLWKFILYTKDDGKSYTLEREELGETGLDLSDVSSRSGGTYASMLYDGETGYLLLAAYTEGAPVSYTHLDVYKRQNRWRLRLGLYGGH